MTDSVGESIQEDNEDKTAIIPMNIASYDNARQRRNGEPGTERSSSRALSPCSSSPVGLVAPSQQSESDKIIREVGPYDILVGRSSECFNNIGNRRFRITISLNMNEYVNAKTRDDKSWVIATVLHKMRQEVGYRFLKKVTVTSPLPPPSSSTTTTKPTLTTSANRGRRLLKKNQKKVVGTDEISRHYYVEVSEKKMREKVGHALRDLSVQLLHTPPISKSPVPPKPASSMKKVGTPSRSSKSKVKKKTSIIKKAKTFSPSSSSAKSHTASPTKSLPLSPPFTTSSGTANTAASMFSIRKFSTPSYFPVPELKDVDEVDERLNGRKFGNGGGGDVDIDENHNQSLNDIWSIWDKDAPSLEADPFSPSDFDTPDDTDFLLM